MLLRLSVCRLVGLLVRLPACLPVSLSVCLSVGPYGYSSLSLSISLSLSVSLCIYIYIYIYLHIHIYMYIYIYAQLRVSFVVCFIRFSALCDFQPPLLRLRIYLARSTSVFLNCPLIGSVSWSASPCPRVYFFCVYLCCCLLFSVNVCMNFFVCIYMLHKNIPGKSQMPYQGHHYSPKPSRSLAKLTKGMSHRQSNIPESYPASRVL